MLQLISCILDRAVTTNIFTVIMGHPVVGVKGLFWVFVLRTARPNDTKALGNTHVYIGGAMSHWGVWQCVETLPSGNDGPLKDVIDPLVLQLLDVLAEGGAFKGLLSATSVKLLVTLAWYSIPSHHLYWSTG